MLLLVKAFGSMMCILYIAGVDYVPVSNVTLTFTESVTSHRINIETIDDRIYEGDGESEVICLRIFNLVEPCPNYVTIGDDVQVLIQENDSKLPIYLYVLITYVSYTVPDLTIFCHTVASGNSLTGWTIDLFYSTFEIFADFTAFRCALNDATLSQCMLMYDCGILCILDFVRY